MEQNQQPEALILVSDRPSAIGDDLYQWALDAEDMIRRLHARNQELEAMLDAVGAGGVSAQRVTQGKDHIEQPIEMVAAQEPFGYFKAEPFGWRDCAETDEGAIALYDAPQPQADARDAIAAAVTAEREACAQVCDEKASKMEQEAQAAEADKEDATSLRSSAWLISVCASNIRARAAIAAAKEI